MTRSWGVALALVGPLGCDEPAAEAIEEDAEVGEHVVLYASPGLEGCGDLVGYIDGVTVALARVFEVDPAEISFAYRWRTPEELASSACAGTIGCAYGDTIESMAAPHDHEVVHIVSHGRGYGRSFFMEGLAVAFERDVALSEALTLPGDVPLMQVLTAPEMGSLSAELYPLAGAFTRFIIDRHGMTRFWPLFAARSDAIADDYAEIFGEPLVDAVADFDARRRDCPAIVSNFKLTECAAPELAWDGQRLRLQSALACGEPGVIGPFLDATARAGATFAVATPGLFEAALASDEPGAAALLVRCGGCDDERVAALLRGADGPRALRLPAGRYALQLAGPADADTTLALRLDRVADGP